MNICVIPEFYLILIPYYSKKHDLAKQKNISLLLLFLWVSPVKAGDHDIYSYDRTPPPIPLTPMLKTMFSNRL